VWADIQGKGNSRPAKREVIPPKKGDGMKKKSKALSVHPVQTALVGARTPDELISLAVQKGSDLSQLEKVLEIRIKYEQNEALKAYHKAMAAFKAEAPVIGKNKNVKFTSQKTGQTTSYSHATLDNVIEVTTPVLSRYGLSATWITTQEAEKICVACKISHELGHSETPAKLCAGGDTSGSKNDVQAIGSTASYLERYTFLAALGLSTKGMDNDAQSSGKPVVVESTAKPAGPVASPLPASSRPTAENATVVNPANECHGCGEIVSDKIRDYSKGKFGMTLCMGCQKNPPRS
jgi:hypothetical protein